MLELNITCIEKCYGVGICDKVTKKKRFLVYKSVIIRQSIYG
jgi:hypothetical protein